MGFHFGYQYHVYTEQLCDITDGSKHSRKHCFLAFVYKTANRINHFSGWIRAWNTDPKAADKTEL